MTREMYDAVTPTNIPVTAQMVAGYLLPSKFAWSQASWDRFPNSTKVRIAVRSSTNDGHVLDVENGDATPVEAPVWAHMRRAAGYAFPTIYCSSSVQAQVVAAFNAAGEPMPLWWLAHYDNVDALPAGAVAKQYADPGPVDRSIVADYWPGVDPAQGGNVTTPDTPQLNRQNLTGGPPNIPAGMFDIMAAQTGQVSLDVFLQYSDSFLWSALFKLQTLLNNQAAQSAALTALANQVTELQAAVTALQSAPPATLVYDLQNPTN